MTTSRYFHATLFFADPRPMGHILEVVEAALGCQFHLSDDEGQDYPDRYEAYVFGFWVHLEAAGTSAGKDFYRLAAGASTSALADQIVGVPIDKHVIELLSRHGVSEFFTPAEYRAVAAQGADQ